MKDKIIFIIGATATGKSRLAVLLAKKINGEIISCDSVSIYRRMDIISEKPSKKMRGRIPHHLIDVVNPAQQYNVAKFTKTAGKVIKDILRKKKIPIIVGGSGLYADSLLYGIFKSANKNLALRKKLAKDAEKFGNKYLYQRLKKLDPEAAAKIHPNNLRRLIRALEVCLLSKKKFSSLKTKRSGLIDVYDVEIFGLGLKRDQLYRRIDKRVDKMFKNGLVAEVRDLVNGCLSKTAGQALGIRELKGYLSGEYDLETAGDLLKRNTRHFAKRQITWFKKNKQILWIDVTSNMEKILAKIITKI